MAKYRDIAKVLRKRIENGIYQPGQALPDQKTLSAQFKTSRMTLQKSLDLLAYEGLTYSQQGSGTYVKNNVNSINKDTLIDQYVGTSALYKNRKVESRILQFDFRLPNEQEIAALKINADQPVYDIIRLRLVDDEPFSIEHTQMPINLIPGITEAVMHQSIYSHITDTLGLTIGSAYRRIGADKPDENDRKYLRCAPDDPILQVSQIVYLSDGTPFELSKSRHRYDMGDIVIVNVNHPSI